MRHILILVMFTAICFGQLVFEWTYTLSDSNPGYIYKGYAACGANNSGFTVIGGSSIEDANSIVRVELNQVLDSIGIQYIDIGAAWCEGASIFPTYDGGNILATVVREVLMSGENIWHQQVIKVDSTGSEDWIRSYPIPGMFPITPSVFSTTNGLLLIASEDTLYSLDVSGDVIWSMTYYEYLDNYTIHAIIGTQNGSLILRGKEEFNGSSAFFTMEVNSQGEPLWDHHFLWPEDSAQDVNVNELVHLHPAPEGGYYLLDSRGQHAILSQISSLQDTLWQDEIHHGGFSFFQGNSVSMTESHSGGLLLCYSISSPPLGGSSYVCEYDGVGNRLWLTSNSEMFQTRHVLTLSDSSYLFTGSILDVSDGLFVGKTNSRLTLKIESDPDNQPQVIQLVQNHPNPFNSSTTIEYEIPEQSEVSLIIYDISGREVQNLVSTSQSAGSYNVTWDGADGQGHQVVGGMYFARLVAGEYSQVIKMLYLK